MEEDRSIASWLTRFSLDRRITVMMLCLSLIVVGVIATLGIPLETFPKGYEFPALRVNVPWRNSPTEEVLEKITLPLEEELSTVRNLDGLNSWTSVGNAGVFLRFKQDTDMDVAYREVRDRLERARTQFPDDADRVFIYKDNLADIPLSAVGVIIDFGVRDHYNLIQQEVVQPILRIDGVASVSTDGLREKEILIELDKEKTDAHGLNIYQLAQELGGDNFTMASGAVRDSGKKFLLRSVAKFTSVEDLENRPLTADVRLKDVAVIKYEPPNVRHVVRVNRRPAFAVIIKKEGDANTVEVSRRVRAAIEDIRKNPRLASVHLEVFWDQGRVIEESLGNLIESGRLGGILAAVVLFVFLRQFRLTAIISLAIPFSVLIALIFMYFAGETLNIVSILGLVICVGLLVDNSVVVAENILRYYQDGLSRRESCIRGAGEIALAITLATLTTVAVFLPVSLVEGEGRFFLTRLSIPITVSLLASLVVALVFIPLCVYLTFPRRAGDLHPHPTTALGRLYARLHGGMQRVMLVIYNQTLDRINHSYNSVLGFFLKHRLEMVLALVIAFALSFSIAFKKVKFAESQEEDQLSFNINVGLSNEFTFEDAQAYFKQLEDVVDAHREEFGIRGYMVSHGSRWGRIEGWLDKDKPRALPAKEIGSRIYKMLPRKAGADIYYRDENQTQQSRSQDVFTVVLKGEDSRQLEEIAKQIEPILLAVPGVLGMRAGNETSPSELALVVDRDRATASNVNPEVIAGVVGYAIRGTSLPRYNDNGRQVPVRIQYQEEDRQDINDLANFLVPSQAGGFLPLSAVTERKFLDTPRGISRQDRRVAHTVTLELEKDKANEAREKLIALQALIDLPEGVQFEALSAVDLHREDLASMQFAATISVIFIYLLMGFLFESFVLPLSIILTIPLAGLGVVWIHYFTEKDMDMLGIVGCILLIGVVVNNGIVLIDYVNQLRLEGVERTQALLLAADRRFRPIAMTALTTIIGMLPLTVSKPSELGMSYKSFGLTLIGGMTTATLLTLLVIPVFYTFFDDARFAVAAALRKALPDRAAPVTEAAPETT